ncbi:unnamed protein product [Protopolystoma xenopodis]|uniref:Uncharacterized protein n=1 Tax=Protopolystoma xenopodis TaxID=117903 RepID=A0A448XLR9_9PLAT|nr:unnamed protein product [Protopolystoma xenopodis]
MARLTDDVRKRLGMYHIHGPTLKMMMHTMDSGQAPDLMMPARFNPKRRWMSRGQRQLELRIKAKRRKYNAIQSFSSGEIELCASFSCTFRQVLNSKFLKYFMVSTTYAPVYANPVLPYLGSLNIADLGPGVYSFIITQRFS